VRRVLHQLLTRRDVIGPLFCGVKDRLEGLLDIDLAGRIVLVLQRVVELVGGEELVPREDLGQQRGGEHAAHRLELLAIAERQCRVRRLVKDALRVLGVQQHAGRDGCRGDLLPVLPVPAELVPRVLVGRVVGGLPLLFLVRLVVALGVLGIGRAVAGHVLGVGVAVYLVGPTEHAGAGGMLLDRVLVLLVPLVEGFGVEGVIGGEARGPAITEFVGDLALGRTGRRRVHRLVDRRHAARVLELRGRIAQHRLVAQLGAVNRPLARRRVPVEVLLDALVLALLLGPLGVPARTAWVVIGAKPTAVLAAWQVAVVVFPEAPGPIPTQDVHDLPFS
jgi:hypothetical protein